MELREYIKKHKESIEDVEVNDEMWKSIETEIVHKKDRSLSKRFLIGFITFLILTMLWLGYTLNAKTIITTISPEVAELKKTLQSEKTTTRLKAVRKVFVGKQEQKGLIDVLLETFKLDESVHVRLAVLNTLKPYAHQSKVKVVLIEALNNNESSRVILEIISILDNVNESDAKEAFKDLSEKHSQPIIRQEAGDAYNNLLEI